MDADLENLIIIVESLLNELKTIKRQKYFRNYYRKHRNRIRQKIHFGKQTHVFKTERKREDGVVYFD